MQSWSPAGLGSCLPWSGADSWRHCRQGTAAGLGLGRLCDPPQDGPSSPESRNADSSKPLCLTFSREETGGSHGPMCGMSACQCVCSWWW